jgi:arylsulfatase A-like enzyme
LSRLDPDDGLTPDSTFRFDGIDLPDGVSEGRLEARRGLLARLDQLRDDAPSRGSGPWGAFDHFRDAALGMIDDAQVAQAVDVTREPDAVRAAYGLTLFGQEALAARRLVEAGVKIVTAFWDDYAHPNNAWDTHFNHFPRLKDGLCPIFDQVLPAFLDDMERRGLLDETLVMVISEHGRTPAIARTPGGGRDHWAGAYWGLFFGAGIKTGQVIGATDRQGGYPVTHPIDPKDILATMYHLLGFNARETFVPDRVDRPIPLIPHGEVVWDLLA